MTLCVPLCDIGSENGPTAIWRGSHRTALGPKPPGEAAIRRAFPVELMSGPLGQSFLFDFRTFHCGMPNMSREPRPLLMFVFTRPWFRDPNMNEIHPSVVITERSLGKVPERHRPLFMLASAARRGLWENGR